MIPKKINVMAKGNYKSGLAVILRFQMKKKNDFYYTVFLDERGEARVEENELLRSFDQDRNLFLMDYVDPRTMFNGQIEARILTRKEIETTIREHETYKLHVSYPPDYLAKLKAALRVNLECNCTLTVEQINI